MTNSVRLFAITAILHCAVSVCSAAEGERILHFPHDRSLGRIKVLDASIKRQVYTCRCDLMDGIGNQDWNDWMGAKDFSEAQGDVVIPAGKKVGLFLNKDALTDLSPLLNLKPDDLFMLSPALMGWDSQTPLSETSMQHISHLTGLKDLRLFQTITPTEAMKHITKLQSLEMLYPPKGLTNKGLLYVAQLKSLKRLCFPENMVTNAGLRRFLPKLTKLEELTLHSGRMNDAGLAFLEEMPRLNYLSLRSGNFTDAGLIHVRKCPSLRVLDLLYLPVTDIGLKHLSGHPGLESLRLEKTKVADRGLPYLKTMPNLKKVGLGQIGSQDLITDAGMVYLAQIDSLGYLRLPNYGITESGLRHISKLKNLKYLWVCGSSNSPLGDAALRYVSKLHSLEFLLIHGTRFSDEGMDDLSKLTNLQNLSLLSDSVTNEGLAKLKTLKSLQQLTLTCKNVTISGLSNLNSLENLVRLQVHGVQQDDSVLDISGLAKLENLTLSTPHKSPDVIVDADLACLSKLKRLKSFVIQCSINSGDMDISGQGLKHLAGLTEVHTLCLGGPNLKDEDFRHFASMKSLLSLIVYGESLTDECLKYLESAPQLRALKIFMGNNVTDKALARLKKKLPNLHTIRIHRNKREKKRNK